MAMLSHRTRLSPWGIHPQEFPEIQIECEDKTLLLPGFFENCGIEKTF
jgi:hypothetical protein